MFRVRAVNSIGDGGWSVPVDATPAASSSVISNVTVAAGDEQIGVTWSVDLIEEPDVCDYQIFYAASPIGPWTLYDDGSSTAKSTTITGISTFRHHVCKGGADYV